MAGTASQQSSEPFYDGSSVVLGTPGASCGIHGRHSVEAQPGHHLAPQLLSSGRNVFEELGTGFTLLAFGAEPRSVAAFESVARSLDIPLKIVSDTWDGDRRAYESRLVLVRPDQYVAWKGDREPNELEAVLRTAAGVA